MDASDGPACAAGAAAGRAGFQPVVTARTAAAAMALSVVDFIQPPPCRSVDSLRAVPDVKRVADRPSSVRAFDRGRDRRAVLGLSVARSGAPYGRMDAGRR